MPQVPAKQFSGIFVSYRRDDSSGHAGRLSDKLVEHFGRDRIFMDIDTIEPGEDFVTVIENAVGSCEVLIAIIGRNWLSSPGGTTGRLDNPNDFVRLEIATALRRDIRVIPVLVQRASMPKPQDLPEDLAKFVRRNAVELTDLRWQSDVDQLISVMERVLAKREESARLAEAARKTEEEGQSREEQEKQRGAEERVRLEEEEAKRRAAEERRREEEEIERREAEEQARLEAHQESSRRRAEEERVRADADAEARRRELSLAAGQRQLDQTSTASTTGAVSPAFKNKRVVLIAVASLVVLLVVAAVIWLPRGHRDSGNANQAAVAQPSAVTQPSTTKPSQTTATTPATPTPTPTPIDVTGTWNVSTEEFPLRLTQKGEIIVINQKMGAAYSEDGRPFWIRVEDGRIIGDKITFCLNQTETHCYKGTVTGDAMEGTDDVNNPLHGGSRKARAQSWSAKRISKIGTQPIASDAREKKRPL